jgi:hypothetical protein
MNFIDKRVSVRRAIRILAKNGIQVDEKEASTILDFLYLMTKTYNQIDGCQNDPNLNEKSNYEKTSEKCLPELFLNQNRK